MKTKAFFLALLATPAAAQDLPAIVIRARVQADRVEVRQQGEARLELRADPGTAEPVRVERSAPAGLTSYRNLTITLDAKARLGGTSAEAAIRQSPTNATATGEPN